MSKKLENVSCLACQTRYKSLLSDLSSNHLEAISSAKDCIVYKKGETIFHEGSRPHGIYCVNSGKIKIFKEGDQGRGQIINFAKSGDFLGYRALLSEEQYNASAQVIEEAKVCFIPKNDFFRVFQEDSSFARRVLKAVCHKVGLMEDQIMTLAQKTVKERLAVALLMLNETYGIESDAESRLIDIALSREDFANIVGTATETVIRLLSEFKDEQLISSEGKIIKILNLKGLYRIANYHV